MLDFAVMIGYARKKRNRSNALDFLSKIAADLSDC